MSDHIGHEREKDIHYHHHIDVHGVVMPTWVAIFLSIMGLSAAVVVMLAVLVFKTAADNLAQNQIQQTKEVRMLGVNIQDIENLLIRSGIATRSDFVDRSIQKENSP